jgi:hypothetical protein
MLQKADTFGAFFLLFYFNPFPLPFKGYSNIYESAKTLSI